MIKWLQKDVARRSGACNKEVSREYNAFGKEYQDNASHAVGCIKTLWKAGRKKSCKVVLRWFNASIMVC